MPQWCAQVQTVGREASELAPSKRTFAAVLGVTACGACWLMLAVADPGFDRYHLPKELWLALAALACSVRAACARGAWRPDRVEQLTLASVALAALASACATTPSLAVRSFTLHAAVAALFLAARTLRERDLEALLVGCALAASGVAVAAWAESYGLLGELSRRGRAPGATLGQRNAVGHLLAVSAPALWYLAARSEARAVRALACIAAAACSGALVLTRSRAAWLAFAFAWVVCALAAVRVQRREGAPRRRWVLPLVFALAGFALAPLAPTRLAWSSATPYRDTARHLFDSESGSGSGRIAQYRATLRMAALHPVLGVGPGNWMVEYPRVSSEANVSFKQRTWLHTGRLANSDWFSLLSEQGPLALLLAALLAVAVVRGARRELALATLAALVVAGSLDAVLQLPATACLAALVLGACSPRVEHSVGEPSVRAEPRRLVRLGAWIAVALWGLASFSATERLLALIARARPGGGFAAAERAVAWNGADLAARLALAEAYALRGDCERARPHVEALVRLLPYHSIPERIGCRQSAVLDGASSGPHISEP